MHFIHSLKLHRQWDYINDAALAIFTRFSKKKHLKTNEDTDTGTKIL